MADLLESHLLHTHQHASREEAQNAYGCGHLSAVCGFDSRVSSSNVLWQMTELDALSMELNIGEHFR